MHVLLAITGILIMSLPLVIWRKNRQMAVEQSRVADISRWEAFVAKAVHASQGFLLCISEAPFLWFPSRAFSDEE